MTNPQSTSATTVPTEIADSVRQGLEDNGETIVSITESHGQTTFWLA